jgi:peptide/nickel transport system permease protein
MTMGSNHRLGSARRALGWLPPLRSWRPGVVLAVVWLGGLTFLAIFANWLPFVRRYNEFPKGPGARKLVAYRGKPSSDYWFGTDKLGRDTFARCIYAAQKTLVIGAASIVAALVIGGLLGMLAGYFRGWYDRVLTITFDVLLAFPAIVLALIVVGRFFASGDLNLGLFTMEKRFFGVILVLTVLSIAPLARIVRAQTMSLAQREYVLAARGLGAGNLRVLVREILPNLLPAMFSVAFTGLAVLLVAEGGLAFLGFSVQLPFPTWGFMINEARPDIVDGGGWAVFFPCTMLFLTVLSFNVLGDRVARRFDIREATL